MCFSSSSSSSQQKSQVYDFRTGAEGSGVAIGPYAQGVTFDTTGDEIIFEGLDFLNQSQEGVENFANSVLELVNNFSQSAVQSTQSSIASAYEQSQEFARQVIAEQNPNDANRIQIIVLAGIAAAAAVYIWRRK